MKIGIIYATKRTEATVQIVSWMKTALEKKGHVVVAEKVDYFTDFNCDHYIIGTAVYAFSVNRAGIFKFIRHNKKKLIDKSFNVFIVCGANKLPPKNQSEDKPLLKFLKYTFIDPDKYLSSLVSHLPQTPLNVACFKGYQEEADKIKENFDAQELIVKKWAESIITEFK